MKIFILIILSLFFASMCYAETPCGVNQLEARIIELEKQVKDLQCQNEEPSGLIWCTEDGCYDENGRKFRMWQVEDVLK